MKMAALIIPEAMMSKLHGTVKPIALAFNDKSMVMRECAFDMM